MENLLTLLLLSPESAGGEIKKAIDKYKPLLYAVLQEGFIIYKDLITNDEYFEKKAQLKWKMYEAYLNAGFSSEQAMMFLVDGSTQLNVKRALGQFGGHAAEQYKTEQR